MDGGARWAPWNGCLPGAETRPIDVHSGPTAGSVQDIVQPSAFRDLVGEAADGEVERGRPIQVRKVGGPRQASDPTVLGDGQEAALT